MPLCAFWWRVCLLSQETKRCAKPLVTASFFGDPFSCWKKFRHAKSTRKITALAATAALAITAAASLVTWAAADESADALTVTPASGPIAGGTTVTLPAGIDGSGFVAVATTTRTSFGLDAQGNVYSWGAADNGLLGVGESLPVAQPEAVAMPGDVAITQISASNNQVLALGDNGVVYAWGANTDGLLGVGAAAGDPVTTPTAITMPDGVTFTAVEAGMTTSLAIDSTGAVWAWGDNGAGQLGVGSTDDSTTPVKVSLPAGLTFTDIAATSQGAAAITSDGIAYAWGAGWTGALGNGGITASLTPVAVTMPAGVTFSDVDGSAMGFVAAGSDGAAYQWGVLDTASWLNAGMPAEGMALVPTAVDGTTGKNISSVASGPLALHALALSGDGQIYAWGNGSSGELGDGNSTDSDTAVQVSQGSCSAYTGISADQKLSLTLCGSDAYAWGDRTASLGDAAASTSSPTPVLIDSPDRVITSVTFDGLEGTELTHQADGTWTVVTPAHPAGPVDVVITTTTNTGTDATAQTLTDGFTYVDQGATTVVTPADPTLAGNTVTIPTMDGVIYQVDGQTVTGTITLADGQTLTVKAVPAEGYSFTAGATTSWGFSYSQDCARCRWRHR